MGTTSPEKVLKESVIQSSIKVNIMELHIRAEAQRGDMHLHASKGSEESCGRL